MPFSNRSGSYFLVYLICFQFEINNVLYSFLLSRVIKSHGGKIWGKNNNNEDNRIDAEVGFTPSNQIG